MAMSAKAVCAAVDAVRGDDTIVVCTMSAMNALDAMSPWRPLTIASVPLMGGAASIGLGLALARPERAVIVLDGDSSVLMELGALVTVAGSGATRLVHLVLANGVQFNGNWPLALPGGGVASLAGIARGAGYAGVEHWQDAASLEPGLRRLLATPGPHFVEVAVDPLPARLGPDNLGPETTDARFTRLGDEARTIRRTLGVD